MDKDLLMNVCRILDIRYSHHDEMDFPRDYLELDAEDNAKPICVIYSSTYGHWTAAILDDLHVIQPCSNLHKETLKQATYLVKQGGLESKLLFENSGMKKFLQDSIRRQEEATDYVREHYNHE